MSDASTRISDGLYANIWLRADLYSDDSMVVVENHKSLGTVFVLPYSSKHRNVTQRVRDDCENFFKFQIKFRHKSSMEDAFAEARKWQLF